MSEKITDEKLRQILIKHAAWVRGEASGSRADLSRADLSRADLSGADLSGARGFEANCIYIGPLGTRSDCLSITLAPTLEFRTGCFRGTKEEFEAAISKTHGDSAHGRAYRAAIALAEGLAAIRAETAPIAVEAEAQQ